jgi:predicted TIM-barrel fold metal-dependent hydrolase
MELKFVMSSDSHIIEPYDLWEKALGKKHGDKVPHRVSEVKGVKGNFFFCGYDYADIGELRQENAPNTPDSTVAVEHGDLPPELAARVFKANSDPTERLKLMEMDGVHAELVQATNFLMGMRTRDTEVVQDCAAVVNDYMADYCGQYPKHLLGCGMIPMHDVDWAVAEAQRVRKRGLRAVMINTDLPAKFPPYRKKVYDKFWATLTDLEMPLILHLGTGETTDPFCLITPEEQEDGPRLFLGIFGDQQYALVNEFIFGGILDRFPKLKIISGEYECSWFPYWFYRCRQMQGPMGIAMHIPQVKHPIDHYVKENLWISFIEDLYFDRSWDVVGEDKIMWGSDYPHPRNTFPNSRAIIQNRLASAPPRVVAKAAGLNCAKLFNVDVPVEAMAAAAE